MDFQVLQSKIESAARAAFEQVRNKYPGQTFCGYALYSDADAITVCPAEWDHEFEGAECFEEISKLLCGSA